MKIRKLREIDYDTVSQFMAELHKLHAESRPDMYRQVEEIGTVYTKEEFYSMLQNDEMITLGADTEEGNLYCYHTGDKASDHGAEKDGVH